MAGFTVTTTTTSAKPGEQVVFSVTNTAHRNLTARGSAMVKDATKAEWIKVSPIDPPAPVDATLEMRAQFVAARDTPPGTYLFGLRVVGVENPDEFTGESQWVSVEVPKPAPVRAWWPYALIAAVAVVLIGAVVFAAIKIFGGSQPGNVTVSASITDFGTVAVGQAGKISVVTLKNVGKGSSTVKLTIGGAQAGDFPAALGSCQNAQIKAGESCQFEMAFQPTAQGTRKATLMLVATGGSQNVDFTGVGQGIGQLSFKPAGSNLNTAPRQITVTNTGTGDYHVVQMTVSDPGTFHITANTCLNATLKAGGGTCTFNVSSSFTGLGLRTDSVVFLGNPGSIQSMPVSSGSLIICGACRFETLAPAHF